MAYIWHCSKAFSIIHASSSAQLQHHHQLTKRVHSRFRLEISRRNIKLPSFMLVLVAGGYLWYVNVYRASWYKHKNKRNHLFTKKGVGEANECWISALMRLLRVPDYKGGQNWEKEIREKWKCWFWSSLFILMLLSFRIFICVHSFRFRVSFVCLDLDELYVA